MKIKIENFRCFRKPSPVDIRPINLLVGENSAGKTSFLAATRFLLELFHRGSQPSFNKEPFHLGSFDQIAHYRGGRAGRAKTFTFEVEDEIPRTIRHSTQPGLFPNPPVGQSKYIAYRLKVAFKDYKSQPTIESVEFSADGFRFECVFADKIKLEIGTPSAQEVMEFEIGDFPFSERFDSTSYGLSYVEFILRDLRYIVRRDDDQLKRESADGDWNNSGKLKAKQIYDEAKYLAELFGRVQRSLPEDVYASAPVRSRPERTYNPADFVHSPDGGHIPFVLAQLHSFDPKKSLEIQKSIAAFGRASGLFDDVRVKQIGGAASGPFQLIVTLPGRKSNIVDVGYGVSQALPIVADLLRMQSTMFLFQQPEVHLHPRAQAELGSFFATVCKQRKHTLFIETHSDYLLDRIRMEVRKGDIIRSQDVSVLYFSRNELDVEIHSMQFDKNGNLTGAPPDYREFFMHEEMRSLGLD